MRFSLPRMATRLVGLVVLCFALIGVALPWSISPVRAQDDLTAADATIRVLHASPGVPEVDVLVDGQHVIEGLAYGSATRYVTVTPEEHRLQIVPSGQTATSALVDETVDAAPGQAYLLAVYGLLNDIQGALYDVDLSEIEPGNARVRLINFSPDAGDVDIVETGADEWFGNVGLGDASDYQDIAAGTYSVDIRGGEDQVLQTVPDVTFADTRVYDVVVLGQLADETLALQSLVTTVSPPCTEVLELEGEEDAACLLVVHAAPDGPPIDVYLNDVKISENLAYGTATESAAVPSGEGRGLRITATGSPPEEAIVDQGLDFQPGQAYEIVLAGAGDELGLTVTGTDLRPVPAGQSRVRLIHAAPDAGAVDLAVAGQEETLFGGVDFRDATDYVVLDAGDYTLQVRPAGDELTVTLESDTTLAEGMTYDLILLNRPEDQALELLALTVAVPIQVGQIATPEAESGDEPLVPTVVPEPVEDMEASPTPTG